MSVTIRALRDRYRAGLTEPRDQIKAALERANSNAGKNVYLAHDKARTFREAEQLTRNPEALQSQILWGVPVSLKDCFDLEGYLTTCGSHFLASTREPAIADSAVASRLKSAGAIITGKTHLHQLAYGITGQNRDFGDCLQPANPTLLTGGSSSGSAASVQEGSAMAAIGTDTGGSVRVPASLCGLAGYRASITLGNANGIDLWHGGEHLAPTFDTLGWFYRNLSDGPLLGAALFGLSELPAPTIEGLRIGVADESFTHECEKDVRNALEHWAAVLRQQGAQVATFDTEMWRDTSEIFIRLQASEAAALHPEPRDFFEPAIRERLQWGAAITPDEVAKLRKRLASFQQESEHQLEPFDFLLLPNCPMAQLRAADDHSRTRARILRYTTPVSMLGRPAVTLPSRRGGPQLVGQRGRDAELLALSAALGDHQPEHA